MFPLLYHAHHTRHPEDLPFWQGLADQQGGEILELGCGTGRVLLPLALAGHTVFGLDNDLAMLHFLSGQAPAEIKNRVHIFQADLTRFAVNRQFALIILPCNTYSTLAEPDRQAALKVIGQHLAPNGLFAASLPNPTLLRRLPAYSAEEVEEVFAHPQDGLPVQVSSAWRRDPGGFHLSWFYQHQPQGGPVERLEAQIHHQLVSARQYLNELSAAGLALDHLYGDFDHSRFDKEESPTLIFTARKPAG